MTRAQAGAVFWGALGVVAVLFPLSLLVLGAMSDGGSLSRLDFSQATVGQFVSNITEVLWGYPRLFNAIGNTLLLCFFMVTCQVSSSLLAGYAFAVYSFRGQKVLFFVVMLSYLLPAIATVIPLFLFVSAVGLSGTAAGILLPYVLFSPYAVFLFRDRFRAVPRDVLAQAQIDGLGAWGIFFRIALPLISPFVWLIGLVTFVSMWNAFLWPSVIAGTGWPTVTVALSSLQGQYGTQWNLVLAGALLALIPALTAFAVSQRHLVTSPLEEIDEQD